MLSKEFNMDIDNRKQLRKAKVSARNSLTQFERTCFSEQISKSILASDVFQKSETIMVYKALKGEVCLSELEKTAKMLGKRLCYPLCVSKSEMIALAPKDDLLSPGSHFWKTGAFGIQEPVPEHSVEITPSEIDLVICPCTAFDEAFGRMGMGAGYYDRYLEQCVNACIVAVAFEVQKAVRVPMELWDKRMDMIFTEKQVYIAGKCC